MRMIEAGGGKGERNIGLSDLRDEWPSVILHSLRVTIGINYLFQKSKKVNFPEIIFHAESLMEC